MSIPDLSVEDLDKRFADHVAVDQLSFAVERGSFFSILGPSGCGKTTLLRMIAGFIVPDGGDIRIGGTQHARRRAESPPGQHGVPAPGAVSDDVGGRERRVRPGAPRRAKRAERERRAAAMLERVGLAGALHKRVDELSGGQRQRVAIARSLVLEPTLLLLDEPLGALDLKLREHMKIELKQLQAAFGTTFVYITHDQSEALVLSDHVAVMNHGRFEQLGTPQELYYEPATRVRRRLRRRQQPHPRAAPSASTADLVEVTTPQGWTIRARASGAIAAGDAVEAFVRPEVASLERDADRLAAGTWCATPARCRACCSTAPIRRCCWTSSTSALRVSHRAAADRPVLGSEGAAHGSFFGFDPQRAIVLRGRGRRGQRSCLNPARARCGSAG